MQLLTLPAITAEDC